MNNSVKDRLMSKISIDLATRCWNWTGSRRSGYGQLGVNRVPRPAHRISYELHVGPIPEGIFVCHHCDNRACINPSHLFLGTAADNAADRDAKGRQVVYEGSAHGSAKLTEVDVLAIRSSGETQRALGRKYGISGTQIHKIRAGKQWKSVAKTIG